MIKRGYQGVYHQIGKKHLDRYISEFTGRQNVRDKDTIDQMKILVKDIDGKRLKYRDLIAP